ncbi:hypothetical protein CAPTEDRAFT_78038, partial [Capitella teleta]
FMKILLTSQGVVTDPEKVKAIVDMPTPTTKKQLKSFLGSVQYIGLFVPRLA